MPTLTAYIEKDPETGLYVAGNSRRPLIKEILREIELRSEEYEEYLRKLYAIYFRTLPNICFE